MHLRTLPRLVAGAATLALATTVLSLPAQAAPPAEPGSAAVQAAVAQLIESHGGTERFATADSELDDFLAQVAALSDLLCVTTSPDTSLVLVDITESDKVSSLMVSADVNTDGVTGLDETCTWAMLVTDDGTSFVGDYVLDVSSSLDPTTRRTSILSGDVALTEPVFTDIDVFANATLSASGQILKPATRWVDSKVTKAKTAKQKKAAKKKYQSAVKSAKKKYAKAGKTKKAKKAMNKRIARAKKTYRKAIAPTVRIVKKKQSYTAKTPFTHSAFLNSLDDVRPE